MDTLVFAIGFMEPQNNTRYQKFKIISLEKKGY